MAEADRERWNARYRGRAPGEPEPSAVLVELAGWIPTAGRAVDLAGGAGANALWLAARGLEVTLVDVADEGLKLAAARAARAGLELSCVRADLESDPLPAGPWDLALCTNYLQRELIARIPALLAPGGRLIWIHPTTTNLERHPKPSRRFLLDPGEAEALVRAAGLELRVCEESWHGQGESARHLARVVARRSAGSETLR